MTRRGPVHPPQTSWRPVRTPDFGWFVGVCWGFKCGFIEIHGESWGYIWHHTLVDELFNGHLTVKNDDIIHTWYLVNNAVVSRWPLVATRFFHHFRLLSWGVSIVPCSSLLFASSHPRQGDVRNQPNTPARWKITLWVGKSSTPGPWSSTFHSLDYQRTNPLQYQE